MKTESTSIFEGLYADYYDDFYLRKDYDAECKIIESMIEKYRGRSKINSVLDAGCGTGQHAVVLSERGYSVTISP